MLQPPQCSALFCRSKQSLPQSVQPLAHCFSQLAALHTGTAVSPGVHLWLQEPQAWVDVKMLMHRSPQSVSGTVHDDTQPFAEHF